MITAPALFRRIHWGGLLTYLLLAIAAGVTGYGLLGIVRGLDATFLIPVGLGGLVAGGLLSRLRLNRGLTLLIISLLGGLLLLLIAGGLSGDFLALISAPFTDLGSYRLGVPLSAPDFPATLAAYGKLSQGVEGIASRILGWFTSLKGGETPFDPLIPSLAWGWVIWVASGWAGWAALRGYKPVSILLPYLVILAGSLGLVRDNPALLILLVGCLLFISPLVSQRNRERHWQKQGTDYSLEIRFDLATSGILLAMLILGIIVVVYLVPWESIFEPKPRPNANSSEQAENMANSFGLTLPTRVPTVLDSYQAPGLPLRHLIGSGPELSGKVALTVEVNQPTGGLPLYWRAFTYDRYLGGGWATSGVETARYSAGELSAPKKVSEGPAITLRIKSPKPGGILYYTGELASVNRSYSLQRRSNEDIFAGYLSQSQSTYQVESTLFLPDPEKLRLAGKAYPDWVKNRYLALPESLPNRVRSLALELTTTQQNNFDKAKAIESYLRRFPYTLDLPTPPQGRDVADYFLFDLKKGYCDYYATTMVVLARAAGIPARLVVGYASGEWDAAKNTYVVHESDGHSWPEVYFPGYGWVEFEPTANVQVEPGQFAAMQPPWYLQTPAAPGSTDGGDAGEARPIPWAWGLAALPIGLMVMILGSAISDRRLSRLSPAAGLSLIYRQLFKKRKDLWVPRDPGQTPYEVAAAMDRRLAGLTKVRWVGKLLQPAIAELQGIVGSYVEAAYSPREVEAAEYAQDFREWQRLRVRLWVAEVLGRLNTKSGRN